MAHDAYDYNFSFLGTQRRIKKAGGVTLSDQTVVKVESRSGNRASKSTKNGLRPDGTRPMASWSRGGGTLNGVRGILTQRYTSWGTVYEDTMIGVLALPGPQSSSIVTLVPQGNIEAIRKALGTFGENEVKLGAALKETRQTAEMLGKYYTRANQLTGKLVDAANGSKRTRQQFRDFLRNGWRDAPGLYLEYLFGMAPIADELANGLQLLADSRDKRSAFLLTLRGKSVYDQKIRSSSYYAPDAGPLSNVLADVATTQTNRATLRFLLPEWYWDRLPPVTPFREAWQTTRLSFVLDWVVPVTTWLGGFEGMQLRPFYYEGCVSEKLVRRVSGAFWKAPVNWAFQPYDNSGGTSVTYTRQVMPDFPTEKLFSLPPIGATFGWHKVRIGAALLAQRLARLQKLI